MLHLPLFPRTTYEEGEIVVRYRAALEPQEVVLSTDGELEVARIRGLVAMIEHGAYAGAEFAPTASRAEALDLATGAIVQRSVRLRLAAVSPLALQGLYPMLDFGAGFGTRLLRGFRLEGALPVDDSPLSMTSRDLFDAWAEPMKQAGAHMPLPYRMVTKKKAKGLALELALAADASADTAARLGSYLAYFTASLTNYPDATGRAPGKPGVFFTIAQPAPRTLTATASSFGFAAPPAMARLQNVLSHFHARVTPIDEVRWVGPVG